MAFGLSSVAHLARLAKKLPLAQNHKILIIYQHNGLLLWRIEESEAELGALVTADDMASAARFSSSARRREHLAWRAALRTAIPVGEVLYDANGAPYIIKSGKWRVESGVFQRQSSSVILSEANCERSEQTPSERRPSRPQGAGEASCERGNDLKANRHEILRFAQDDASYANLQNMESVRFAQDDASYADLQNMESVRFAQDDATHIYIGVSHTKGLAAVILSDRRCAVDVERLDRDFSKTRSRFISESEERLLNSGNPHSAAAGESEQLFAAAVWCAKETLYKLAGRRELDLLRDIAITGCDLSNGTITGSILNAPPITLHAQIVEQWIIVWGVRSGVS